MIVHSYKITSSMKLEPIEVENIEELIGKEEEKIWIDLDDFTTEELKEYLNSLDISGLSKRLCLEAGKRSGFYPLKREIIFVIPVLPDDQDPTNVVHVTFVCRENVLLTLHYMSLRNSSEFEESIGDSEAWLPGPSISALVSAFMIDISLECIEHSTRIRESINSLEERMEKSPGEVEASQILGSRSEVVSLEAIVGDQIPSMEALSKTSKPFFKLDDALEYLNCALANLQAVDGSLNKLNERVKALRLGFEMNAQDQTNRRLNWLTILSAVFNPATLLAGIWGMNFANMPELSLPFAYPIGLGIMVLVGMMMYFFFRRDGWFN